MSIKYKGKTISGGSSLPPGGTTNQVLAKASNANGDVKWANGVTIEQVNDALDIGLSAKQDKLIGAPGQVVGFTATGDAVAQDAPITGITQEEADSRYLQLSGGKMTGSLQVDKKASLIIFGASNPWESSDTSYKIAATSSYRTSLDGSPTSLSRSVGLSIPNIVLNGAFYGNFIRLQYVGGPVNEYDAATKKYVDDAIEAAITGAIEEAY